MVFCVVFLGNSAGWNDCLVLLAYPRALVYEGNTAPGESVKRVNSVKSVQNVSVSVRVSESQSASVSL